ncbi:hypothetical protein Trydic_g9004 [Trypoxylus dichotomus]
MKSVVLVALCSVWMFAYGVELPSYLRKCSKSDPNLNQCLIDNSNFAVPKVVRGMYFLIESYAGEARFNWPLLSPLLISELELPGSDFTVILRDVRLEGLEDFKVTDMRQVVNGAVPLYFLTADYTIQDKGLSSRSILGGGKLKISLGMPILKHLLHQTIVDALLNDISGQNTYKFNFDLDRTEKRGETHLKFGEDVRFSLKTKHIFYNFEDFIVSDPANFDEFIRKHKEIVEYMITPAIERMTLDHLQHVLSNFLDRAPLKDIFDP